MLVYMGSANSDDADAGDLAAMPRGGPDASCLDRMLQTDRLEYLDRDDVDYSVKAGVIYALDRVGSVFREHDRNAGRIDRKHSRLYCGFDAVNVLKKNR